MATVVTGARLRRGFRSRRRSRSAIYWSAGFLGFMILVAVLGPWLSPHAPNSTDLLAINTGPSLDHPFGTDELGRDILARVLYGARISLFGPLVVMVASTVFGTILAVSAAWLGGRFDTAIGVGVDIALAFPSILLAILVAAFVGPGLWAPIIAISIAYVPYSARIIRGAAISERSLPYIEALHLQGLRGLAISMRHLIPNMAGMIAALSTLAFGYAMVDLAAISFLGLGVQPPQSDWGTMVSAGKENILVGAPQEALAAGGCIVATVIAVNILGEALADRANRRDR